jgi:putative nucleotidyltransferase with HDIG domain
MPSVPARVVIVDDDPAFLSMLVDLLEESGHEVQAHTEPGAALRRVEQDVYDVALLDLVMPGIGGLELGDKIKALSPDTEILILTGYADLQSAVDGIRHGIFDYLDKSQIDHARLERSVRDAAARARLARQNRELRLRLQVTNRQLRSLLDVTAALAAEPHQDRLLESLVRAARDLARAGAARVLLLEKTLGGYVIEAAAGDGAAGLVGARLQAGEGLATLAAETDGPVLVLRPAEHPRYSPRCDAVGATAPTFLAVPLRHGDIFGSLVVAGRDTEFGREDGEMLAALARQGAVSLANARSQERAVNFFTHVSDMLVSFLEQKDVHYPGHSRRVAALAGMVTRRMGMSDAERRDVHFAALLHDIGKLLVSPDVLYAPGPPTEATLAALREHPTLALQLLRPISLWEDLLPIIHSHHERWDGKGYPLGLSGEEIPVGARIVAVADAFDAMTRSTPHGQERSGEAALAELEACAGTQFDPRIVRLFVAE